MPWTGSSAGARLGYVIDHVKALTPGGSDTPENMQWQTTAEARAKDTATPAYVEARILPLMRENGIRSVEVVVDGNRCRKATQKRLQ